MNNSRSNHAYFGLMQQLCFQSEKLKSEVIHISKKYKRLSEKKKVNKPNRIESWFIVFLLSG